MREHFELASRNGEKHEKAGRFFFSRQFRVQEEIAPVVIRGMWIIQSRAFLSINAFNPSFKLIFQYSSLLKEQYFLTQSLPSRLFSNGNLGHIVYFHMNKTR